MKKWLLTFYFCSAIVAGCGGGGGSSSPTFGGGTGATVISAADGSAMVYGSVTISSLVDNTSFSSTANINGNLAIPTSGVTFPAIVKVQSLSGGKANYGYIASSAQASAPVNPLSTLILSIASNGNPATITSTTQLNSSSLAVAKTAVNAIFKSVFQAFSVSGSTDLLSTNFPTDHTGLDLILDALNVKFDATGNPTICTKLLNACKTLDLANLDTTAFSISASEVSFLNSAPIASCSNAISSLTASSITTDSTLYASDFLNSGLNAQAYRQSLSAKFGGMDATFNSPIFIGTDSSNSYVFQFDYINTSTNQYAGSFTIPFKIDSSGKCVMAGDQLPFFIQVTSQITVQTRVDGTSNAAATTSSPVRGLVFKAGGDASVQDTVTVNGSPVTIKSLQFYMCDSSNNCSNRLMDMVKGTNNNGYYYTPNGVNTIPVSGYSTAGINTPDAFYNGNVNPILVKMIDSGGIEQKRFYLKIKGSYITAAEMNAITLPSITNAQAILGTSGALVNPSLTINVPTGTIVQSVSLASGLVSGQVTGTSKFVLSGTSLSTAINRTIDSSSDYRSIQLSASTTSGTPISIKYVWSPTCSGCV